MLSRTMSTLIDVVNQEGILVRLAAIAYDRSRPAALGVFLSVSKAWCNNSTGEQRKICSVLVRRERCSVR